MAGRPRAVVAAAAAAAAAATRRRVTHKELGPKRKRHYHLAICVRSGRKSAPPPPLFVARIDSFEGAEICPRSLGWLGGGRGTQIE